MGASIARRARRPKRAPRRKQKAVQQPRPRSSRARVASAAPRHADTAPVITTEQPRSRWRSRLPSRAGLKPSDFVSAADLFKEPKPEFLVEGLLFRGQPFSFFGQPGIGKSLAVLYLGACVASGKPFANRAVNLAEPGSVIYVVAEGQSFIGARLRAIREAHDITEDALKHLHILRRPVALTDVAEVDDFIETLTVVLHNRPPAALIIFDTLSRCLGRAGADENSGRDMALLSDCIDAIAEETGAAVGFVDHTGWNGAHERGSSIKRGNVGTAMLVTRDSKKNLIKIASEKTNHHEATPILLTIEKRADAAVVVPLAPRRADNFSAEGRADELRSLGDNDLKALRALTGNEVGLSFTRWQQISGVASTSLSRVLKRLREFELITQEGPSSRPRYKLTTEGRHYAVESEPT